MSLQSTLSSPIHAIHPVPFLIPTIPFAYFHESSPTLQAFLTQADLVSSISDPHSISPALFLTHTTHLYALSSMCDISCTHPCTLLNLQTWLPTGFGVATSCWLPNDLLPANFHKHSKRGNSRNLREGRRQERGGKKEQCRRNKGREERGINMEGRKEQGRRKEEGGRVESRRGRNISDAPCQLQIYI